MSMLSRCRSWLHAVIRRAELNRAMQIEMETHVDLYEHDLIASGTAG